MRIYKLLEKHGGYSGIALFDVSIEDLRVSFSKVQLNKTSEIVHLANIALPYLWLDFKFVIEGCPKEYLEKNKQKIARACIEKVKWTPKLLKDLYLSGKIDGRNELRKKLKQLLKEE